MKARKLGTTGIDIPAIGLGCMGMSSVYGAADDATSIAVIHRAIELGVNLPRHAPTSTAPAATRSWSAGRSRASATRSCSRPSSATSSRKLGGRQGLRHRRQPGLREAGGGGEPPPAGRGDHRSLLPAPGRSPDADRGDRGRDGRAGEGGEGALPRPLRGGTGDDPAGARGASDRGAADRILALDARPRGRAPGADRGSSASPSSPTVPSAADS